MIVRSMLRLIRIFLISIFLVIPYAEAGIFSKIVKGSAIVQGSKFLAKKIIKNGIKDSTKPLLKNELKVNKYGKLTSNPEKGLDYHHIPSVKQIEKYGIKKNDGVAIGLEHDRHSLTRTYKSGNKPILRGNETPREALARDVKDVKKILKDNNLFDSKAKEALKDVIKQNKDNFPNLYKKP